MYVNRPDFEHSAKSPEGWSDWNTGWDHSIECTSLESVSWATSSFPNSAQRISSPSLATTIGTGNLVVKQNSH